MALVARVHREWGAVVRAHVGFRPGEQVVLLTWHSVTFRSEWVVRGVGADQLPEVVRSCWRLEEVTVQAGTAVTVAKPLYTELPESDHPPVNHVPQYLVSLPVYIYIYIYIDR